MTSNAKILLVDDHPLVRECLANLINLEPGLEVSGTAGSILEARQSLATAAPNLAIVDIWLGGGSGLELIKDIHVMHPEVATVVLSMHDEMLYAERAMRAGAQGYVMKREATGKILEAIKAVLAGQQFYSAAVNSMLAQKLVRSGARSLAAPMASLSDRELEVFEFLGQGQTTRQIAEHLNLSAKTVQVYFGRIKDKLNLANINELIAHAVRWHENRASHHSSPGL